MNIYANLLAIFMVSSNIPYLQCQQLPRSQNSYSSPYFKTVVEWAQKNPVVIATAALGVIGTLGYYFYRPLIQQLPPLNRPEQPIQIRIAPQLNFLSHQAEVDQITRKTHVDFQEISHQLPLAHTRATPTVQGGQFLEVPQDTRDKIKSHEQESKISYASDRSSPAYSKYKSMQEKRRHEHYVQEETTIDPIFWQLLKRRYKNPETIIIRYNNGRDVFHAVIQKNKFSLTTLEVSDLLWFLYIEAIISKSKHYKFFEEVTFLINGQENEIQKLYKTLGNTQSCSLSPQNVTYSRMSSHYPEWFSNRTDLFAHQGIDVPDLPPMHMGTVLFAKDPGSSRMYIKPEEHGTAQATDLALHSVSYLKSLATKKLPPTIKEYVSYVINLPVDVSDAVRKERVDTDLYIKAVELVLDVEKSIKTVPNVETLTHDMKTQGIRVIYPKIIDYLYTEQIEKGNPVLYGKISRFYNEKLKPFEKDWQIRKGNEIIFTIDELLKASALRIDKKLSSQELTQEQQALYYSRT